MKQMLRNYGEVVAAPGVRTVLLAAGVSVAGDAAAMVALLLRLHDAGTGPWGVSLLLVAFAAPVVLTMGPAGSLADRADPRWLLLVTALVQVLAAGALAVADGVATTLLLVVVLQTGFALGNPAWAAVVPRLVPEGTAGRVAALQHAVRGIAGPLGAGVGGLLVQWHGSAAALLLDAATFLALGLAALTLPVRVTVTATGPERAGAPAPAAGRGGRRALARLVPREGLAALRADCVVGVLVLALLPFVMTVEAVNVVEVFLVRDVLGAGPAGFGLVETVHGAAAVLGAVLAGTASTRAARVRWVLLSLAVVSLAQVAQGLAPGFLVYLALAAGTGALLGAINALVLGLVLDELDPAHRGAVIALVSGLSRAAGTLAVGLGGVVGSLAGPRATYVVAGSASLVVAAFAAWRVHRSVDGASTARASHDGARASTLEA